MKTFMKIAFLIIPAVFYIWIEFSTDHGTLPLALGELYSFPGGDKVGHFVVMGTVTTLCLASIRLLFPLTLRKRSTIITLLILVAIFTAEEFSQRMIPSRTFSLMDLLASYAGTLSGATLAILVTFKKQSNS